MPDEELKPCTMCGKEKPLTEFYLKKGKPRSICKSCSSWDYKKRYPKEKERLRSILKHNISVRNYFEILAEQRGCCAICGEAPDDDLNFFVDHDHACCPGQFSCGKCIRGLLCRKCNTGLGMFRDNTKYLESAIQYLSWSHYA